jgi:hypothetical protein
MAVAITSATGFLTHGSTLTIAGTGFGTKTTAAPYVWDDCSGTDPTVKWDFVYPHENDAAFRLTYRTPAQVTRAGDVAGGVALPHSHVTKYLAGAHYNSAATPEEHSGTCVCAGKNSQEGFAYSYISFYMRIDPNWTIWVPPANTDHNFKEYAWTSGTGYLGQPCLHFKMEYIHESTVMFGVNYGQGMWPDIFEYDHDLVTWYSDQNVYPKVTVAGPISGWHKVEYVLKHHSADGFHLIFYDNVRIWDVDLNDDQLEELYPGQYSTARAETVIGGYSREVGTTDAFKNNWRYYADVYYDHSLARVMIGNASTYLACTIVEPQILSAWSDTSITATLNQARLDVLPGKYLYVFDAAGVVNAAGYALEAEEEAPPETSRVIFGIRK